MRSGRRRDDVRSEFGQILSVWRERQMPAPFVVAGEECRQAHRRSRAKEWTAQSCRLALWQRQAIVVGDRG